MPVHHNKTPQHLMTIDVEDYFQVAAFEAQCPIDEWTRYECRVERNVLLLLELLDNHSTLATFFILGWIAERYPKLICEIRQRGHEVASHGYHHQRLNTLSRQQFRDDIMRSKALLEDLSGARVEGYRAPSFSMDENRPWIQEELLTAGYRYSSSINPVPHDLYGYQNASRIPFQWHNGLIEIPVTTCEIAGRRIPCAGGGYFRLYPYALSKNLLRKARQQLGGTTVFYMHPWEIDPGQPRIANATLKSRLRHYINLKHTLPRLEQLLIDFNWGRMCDLEIVKTGSIERR